MSLTVINDWNEWVALCLEFGENPHKVGDLSKDIGMGNTIDFEYVGKYPKEEE